jgi:hypothetical protein
VIGCVDAEQQRRFYNDLHRRVPSLPSDPPPLPILPRFITVLPRGTPRGTVFLEDRLYGVSWSTVISDAGTLRYGTPERLREALGLPGDAKLCFIGTGPDESLERFWTRTEPSEAFGELARLKFAFATTASYSVWDSSPRFDQIYNQERNLATYDWLTSYGIPTIPFLFCALDADYKAAGAWLTARPAVNTVAASAQSYYHGRTAFYEFLRDLRRLEDAAGRSLRFLVVGCCHARHIELLFEHFSIAAIASSQPISLGRSGRLCKSDLTGRYKAPLKMPRQNLITECIGRCEAVVAAHATLSPLTSK